MHDLRDKNVLITGGNSMIGYATKQVLLDHGSTVISVIDSKQCDLTKRLNAQDLFLNHEPEYVFHLAGYNGGIDFNKRYPADIYFNTVSMGINVLNSAVVFGKKVEKILFIIPSCALEPQNGEQFEEHLYTGQPHPSVECHGLAKRAVEAYGRQIEKQHGIKFVSVICNNSFGPRDHFDEMKGKVISGMITKFVHAKNNNLDKVVCWGTGKPLREFIYCKDVAKGLVEVMKNYDYTEPVNLTSDFEISMYDLAHCIKKAVGYEGEIIFDTTKPDGQMRKKLNSARMHKNINIKFTPFEEAIQETVDWYLSEYKQ